MVVALLHHLMLARRSSRGLLKEGRHAWIAVQYKKRGEAGADSKLTCVEFISNLRTTLMATSGPWPLASLARYTLLKAPSPIFSNRVHRSNPGYFGSFPWLSLSSATILSMTDGSVSFPDRATEPASPTLCLSPAALAAAPPAWAATLRLSMFAAEKSAPGTFPCCKGLWSRTFGSVMAYWAFGGGGTYRCCWAWTGETLVVGSP